jgi:6-phosphogluconolactonase (cycloisomerase 2 family)
MAYTSNNENPTPSVGTFSVDSRGRLALIDSAAADAATGIDRPVDIDLSDDGEFLYVLNTGTLVNGTATPQISVFRTGGGAGLELVETFDQGLPLSTSSPFEDIEGVFGLAVL